MLSEKIVKDIKESVLKMKNIKKTDIYETDVWYGIELIDYIIRDKNSEYEITSVDNYGFDEIVISVKYKDIKHKECVPVESLNKISNIYAIANMIIYYIEEQIKGGELNE